MEDGEGNQLGTSPILEFQLDADTEAIAVFEDIGEPEEQLYSLQTVADPFGSGTILGGGAYLPGTEVTLTAVPLGTNLFAGWSGDASGVAPSFSLTMDGHKKVTAFFGDISEDTDEDGLSDLYERSLGTDPEDEDSDNDDLSDGDEMNLYGSDPLKADSDDDGFTDKEEVAHGTGPKDPDDFPFLPKFGLSLRYQFKTKAFDLAPGRHHGKVSGAILAKDRYNEGKNAYQFTGNKSTITASGYNGIGGSAARTISVWVRGESGATGGLLHWGAPGMEFGIAVTDSKATLQANGNTRKGSTNLLDGNWHQVLVTLPEGGSLNDATLYVDGQVETTTGGATNALNSGDNNSLVVGSDADGQYFTGYIDDIWVWSRSLAPSEVSKHFAAEEATEPPEPELVRPAITTQPVHTTVAEGADATLTVAATGKPDPAYQ